MGEFFFPTALTQNASPANMQAMAYSFLIFDFGGNEEGAQKARHRIDGWKQAFRLDKKLQLKFERKEPQEKPQAEPAAATSAPPREVKSSAKGKTKPKKKTKAEEETAESPNPAAVEPAHIRLIVRLDFSDHEKLSHQRWLERIPVEEPFNSANPRIVRGDDPEFGATSTLFDALD